MWALWRRANSFANSYLEFKKKDASEPADTGVEGESAVPGLVLAGGLTVMAAAGATVVARRRATQG